MMRDKHANRAGLTAVLTGILALACPSMAAAQGRDPAQALAQADANGDGSVSWNEVVAMRTQSFDKLDRNRDGYIAANDRPSGPFGARFDEAYGQVQGQFDANGDRRVSRAEMLNAPGAIFTKADVDGNKVLSAEELTSLRAAAASAK
jgi:hypothetical protein